MSVKLSICIPTYNRADLLGELFASLAPAMEGVPDPAETIEVCVSDNASTDHTAEVIAKWQALAPCTIKYSVNEQNIGPDGNYLRSVSIASGEFCWLFGSDDTFVPGAIKEALEQLDHADLLISNRIECDLAMRPHSKKKWFASDVAAGDYDFKNADEVLRYLSGALSVGAIFSFLSCIIVRRELWNSVPDPERFVGSAYSHVYILLRGLFGVGTLRYVDRHWVYNRQGNDHFMQQGKVERILLDLRAYPAISELVFDDYPAVHQQLLSVLRREQPYRQIRRLFRLFQMRTWGQTRQLLQRCGYGALTILRAQLRGFINF